jgi:hypothetical protein
MIHFRLLDVTPSLDPDLSSTNFSFPTTQTSDALLQTTPPFQLERWEGYG